jgi:RNA polymerase sigma-70 factor, ECF subfamily
MARPQSIQSHIPNSMDENKLIDTGIDYHWLDKCADNERVAQEFIYRKYFSTLTTMCQKYTTDEDEIISIVNDGFLKAFKKIAQFERKGSFEGWLRRLMYTTMVDHFRKKKMDISFLEVPEVISNNEPQILESLYFDDVAKLISKLPESMKNVFLKYHLEGYSHADIAKEFSISEGTSKWYLHQAKITLQKMIKNTQT